MEIDKKVVAITDGASGLGETFARSLVRDGARVAILDRTRDGATLLSQKLDLKFFCDIDVNVIEPLSLG